MAEAASATRQTSGAGNNAPEFSVSELSSAIKRALEGTFGYVRLRGEISGFRGVHSSGHCYFALKDDKAKIEAVIWRSTFAQPEVQARRGAGGDGHRAHHVPTPANPPTRSSSMRWSRPASAR